MLALALVLSAAPSARAGGTAPQAGSTLGDAPLAPAGAPRLTEEEAIAAAFRARKIRDWVARYPARDVTKDATYERENDRWTVKVFATGEAGQIVLARVDDASGRVAEAWTGPQVAWTMARGAKGSFGRRINDTNIWLAFCAAFLVGLGNWRRPLSVKNLDLLVLLSFSVSLWFFNRGEIFTSVPLAYPPLVYLLARVVWIGHRGRSSPAAPVWPVWVLLAATVFLAGFKVGLNTQASNVIDVGLASVVGAERIASDGEIPYGHMPTDDGARCGEPDAEGYVRDRMQTNGRCESAIERGDTYGPVTYLAYVPGYLLYGWSGKWDRVSGRSFGNLPAAHFTAIAFDMLALLGLGLVGRRLGGARLGSTLAFAWAAYPFTQYVSNSNSNDAIVPALLVWGFLFVSSARARGLFVGLASWAKFAPLLLAPLWASYPTGLRRPRGVRAYVGGVALATALSFWILLLEPDPLHAARVFWDRTLGWQLSRPSPFSLWNWEQYRYPDLSLVQTVLKGVLLAGALALGLVPRKKSSLQLAALTGALLIGCEIVLTHWFYLYIPWFFPFVAIALLAPAGVEIARRNGPPPRDHAIRELVSAR